MTAFRFPGGSSLVRSSANAASRAATSRSPFFAWKNSFVMSSAARIAALCVSTIGPCDKTFFSAWSTYAATSRVYSGGRSDRTVYSSPPIITLTACFLVLTEPPPRWHPGRSHPPPPGQLVRHVAKDGLELVEHLRISSLSVVRQAHPPEPRDPAPAAHPRPARAASARDRGTCSARPRRGALPGCRSPDTHRTPRAARAAAPRSAAGRRTPGRR